MKKNISLAVALALSLVSAPSLAQDNTQNVATTNVGNATQGNTSQDAGKSRPERLQNKIQERREDRRQDMRQDRREERRQDRRQDRRQERRSSNDNQINSQDANIASAPNYQNQGERGDRFAPSPEQRARFEKHREMMRNLPPEKKELVKKERQRHREEMRRITGVELPEPPMANKE